MAKEAGHQSKAHNNVVREADLKLCDLCGSLNLCSNAECFVCGWHSYFERSPEVVRAAMEIVVQRHGRLELQHLTNIYTYREEAPTFQNRAMRWFNRIWDWLSG